MNKARRFHDDERGVIAVMVALMLVLMLGILALVMDLGNARQQRREAQNSADAAALAGAEVIEAGGATLTWTSVVDQVKKYARANDDVATSAWVGCTDANALPYHPVPATTTRVSPPTSARGRRLPRRQSATPRTGSGSTSRARW